MAPILDVHMGIKYFDNFCLMPPPFDLLQWLQSCSKHVGNSSKNRDIYIFLKSISFLLDVIDLKFLLCRIYVNAEIGKAVSGPPKTSAIFIHQVSNFCERICFEEPKKLLQCQICPIRNVKTLMREKKMF